MSEEKQIKDIVEILELAKEEIESNNENITATLDLQDLKSLKNLYDLYNKEKALNEELQIRYKIENDKYNKEKEKNKELIEGQIKTLEKILLPQLLKKYVSKDKIKEKIRIRKEEKSECKDSIEADKILREIYVLEELLEEES